MKRVFNIITYGRATTHSISSSLSFFVIPWELIISGSKWKDHFFIFFIYLFFLKAGTIPQDYGASGSTMCSNLLHPGIALTLEKGGCFLFSDIDSISLVFGGAGPGSRVGMKLCLVRLLSVAPCTVGTVMDLTARLEVAQLQFTIYNYLFILKKIYIIIMIPAWNWWSLAELQYSHRNCLVNLRFMTFFSSSFKLFRKPMQGKWVSLFIGKSCLYEVEYKSMEETAMIYRSSRLLNAFWVKWNLSDTINPVMSHKLPWGFKAF